MDNKEQQLSQMLLFPNIEELKYWRIQYIR